MNAKTAAQRQADKRARDKLSEEERQARLLSRRITIELFHSDDAKLKRCMSRANVTEAQDVISRLIWAADRLSDEDLSRLLQLQF